MYKIQLGSSIHPEHIGVFHKQNHEALWNFWETQGSQHVLGTLMDYNPYLGRVTENSAAQERHPSHSVDKGILWC
ncbi:MAG: hypothetical protein CM15mV12_2180 [uncultured marine virus]|nr:MAG: hypothetical protein CM15mV12_2180 [uncultured marine virus]